MPVYEPVDSQSLEAQEAGFDRSCHAPPCSVRRADAAAQERAHRAEELTRFAALE